MIPNRATQFIRLMKAVLSRLSRLSLHHQESSSHSTNRRVVVPSIQSYGVYRKWLSILSRTQCLSWCLCWPYALIVVVKITKRICAFSQSLQLFEAHCPHTITSHCLVHQSGQSFSAWALWVSANILAAVGRSFSVPNLPSLPIVTHILRSLVQSNPAWN